MINKTLVIECAGRENFDPKDLISLLKADSELNKLFNSDADVYEYLTIEKHTILMMNQYEKYFSKNYNSILLSKCEFRLAMALHDIGKPISVEKTGKRSDQHLYTLEVVMPIIKDLGFSEKDQNIVYEMINHDILGAYFCERYDLARSVKEICEIANRLKCGAVELLSLFRIFYFCDASSYTKNAGCRYSLDLLFDFSIPDFSAKIRTKYDLLSRGVETW